MLQYINCRPHHKNYTYCKSTDTQGLLPVSSQWEDLSDVYLSYNNFLFNGVTLKFVAAQGQRRSLKTIITIKHQSRKACLTRFEVDVVNLCWKRLFCVATRWHDDYDGMLVNVFRQVLLSNVKLWENLTLCSGVTNHFMVKPFDDNTKA